MLARNQFDCAVGVSVSGEGGVSLFVCFCLLKWACWIVLQMYCAFSFMAGIFSGVVTIFHFSFFFFYVWNNIAILRMFAYVVFSFFSPFICIVTSSSASLPNRTIAAVATASTVIISLVMTLFQRYVFKH